MNEDHMLCVGICVHKVMLKQDRTVDLELLFNQKLSFQSVGKLIKDIVLHALEESSRTLGNKRSWESIAFTSVNHLFSCP